MEEHEENGGAQGNPGNYVKNGLDRTPLQGHANRRPQHQAVILAKHEEKHAGADLPAGHAIAAVEVKSDGSFADLLVHQGENVGAGANGQNIGVADFRVEPVDHAPNNQAIENEIKKTVWNHQGQPVRPADILKASQEVRKQTAALGRGSMAQAAVKIGEA